MATSTKGTGTLEPMYRIAEVANHLHISRPTVYNLLRGEFVVDFARPGRKGIKLVPESTVRRLLECHKKRFR